MLTSQSDEHKHTLSLSFKDPSALDELIAELIALRDGPQD